MPSKAAKRPAADSRALGQRKRQALAKNKTRSKPSSKKVDLARITNATLGLHFLPVKSHASVAKGEILFKEQPFVAVQAARNPEEHVEQQPLFCAECFRAAGPLEAALALAANRISRAELLEFARSNDGDGPGLVRWLDFASKTACLPNPTIPSNPVFAVALPSQTGVDVSQCFCSMECRDAWLRRGHPSRPPCQKIQAWTALLQHAASSIHKDVLLMAADITARVAWPCGKPVQPLAAIFALEPLLCLADNAQGLPSRTTRPAYRFLIDTLEESVRRQAQAAMPFDIYAQLVSALDKHSWLLNGMNMPSALGRYCEMITALANHNALRVEMLSTLGPVVKALMDQQDNITSDSEDDEGNEAGDVDQYQHEGNLSLLPPEDARLTKPIVLTGLFSEEDILFLKNVSNALSSKEHDKHSGGSQWRTRYLHVNGEFRRKAPALLDKLTKAAIEADASKSGWGLLKKCINLNGIRPRVIEHHIVSPGGSLPDPTHFDGGSLITIDIMLNSPGSDFDGGEFCTVERDGSVVQHAFGQGDALVFVSHKPHHVQPVRSGTRETLIMELWEGEERQCDHRCPQHVGTCPLEYDQIKNGLPAASSSERQTGQGNPGSLATCEAHKLVMQSGSCAFAASAFEGLAFFPRIGQVMAQSDRLRQESINYDPNVEVIFDDIHVIASLRALRRIRPGDLLIAARSEDDATDGSSD